MYSFFFQSETIGKPNAMSNDNCAIISKASAITQQVVTQCLNDISYFLNETSCNFLFASSLAIVLPIPGRHSVYAYTGQTAAESDILGLNKLELWP